MPWIRVFLVSMLSRAICIGLRRLRIGLELVVVTLHRRAKCPAGVACGGMEKLAGMVRARVHDQADQAVWTILQRSVARALEYGMRICPWACS